VAEDDFEAAVKTGDSLGMQTPVSPCTTSQDKSGEVQRIRENVSFSEVLGMLDDPQIAAKGLEPLTRGL
jgi:hypothetical protein